MNTLYEMLVSYREMLIDLEGLENQLNAIGGDGRPGGLHGCSLDRTPATNMSAAAALQAAEHIEAMIRRRNAELGELSSRITPALTAIQNLRTAMIINRYYMFAQTDEQIGRALSISTARVNQLRLRYMRSIRCSA